MPFDSMGLRRWLLATVAAWAALVWLAGLFGLGGRIQPLPDDPALVQPLPGLAPAAAAPLQPLSGYADIAARPLFADDRRPHPFRLSGAQDLAPRGFDYRLTGVLRTASLQMALLQPAEGGEPVRVRVGDEPPQAPGWRLVELAPRSARFEGPEGVRVLELRTFDGGTGMGRTAPMGDPAAMVPPAVPARMDTGGAAAAVSGPPAGDAAPAAAEARSEAEADAEAELIRRRIEERRARLREQQTPGAARDQNQ